MSNQESVLSLIDRIFPGGAFLCGLMLYDSDPELGARLAKLYQQDDDSFIASADQFAAQLREMPLMEIDDE